jgi:hypothetical protein
LDQSSKIPPIAGLNTGGVLLYGDEEYGRLVKENNRPFQLKATEKLMTTTIAYAPALERGLPYGFTTGWVEKRMQRRVVVRGISHKKY